MYYVWQCFCLFPNTAVKPPTEAELANDVISDIRPGKVVQLGIQLGLPLEAVRDMCVKDLDHFKRYMTVFDMWKNSDAKPYTWDALVKALKSQSVREMALARKLQRKHCT